MGWAAAAMLLLGSCAQNATPAASAQTETVQAKNANLLAGNWRLVRLNGQTVTVAEAARTPQLSFQVAEQRVTGYTGCNRLTGGAIVSNTHISFQGVASTRMACIGEALEQPFLAALSEATLVYQVTQTQLTLLKEGQPVLEFERAPQE